MGVPAELLGKQVRCPNCKQVVLAPVNTGPSGVVPALSLPPPPPQAPQAPAPAAPQPAQTEAELPTFAPPRRVAADSVFSDPEESEDEVFSQPGSRVPTVSPLDLTAPHAASHQRPAARNDNPFEMSAPTAASQAIPQRPERPAAPGPAPTSELPNPFLELEPVTLPAVFANPSGSKPAAPTAPPSAATQPFPAPVPFPAPAPRPAYPTPGTFPAPFPVPAPVPANSNPFAGIDDPSQRPVSAAAPTAGPETATEELDDQPRRRRRKRGEEEPPKPEEKPQRSTRTRLPAAPAGAAGGGSNLVLYIVIGYAVLATLLAIYGLFIKSGDRLDPGHPLSTIPDTFGEFSPSKRKELGNYTFANAKSWIEADLPDQQKTRLKDGNKITVGKLEIEPVKIERRQLEIETEFKTGEKRPDKTSNFALVLTLNIKNMSDKPIFPMDPAFTRKLNPVYDPPITRIVVNKKDKVFIAGGAIDWPIQANGPVKKKYEREQARDWEALKPGETRPYVVFTAAELNVFTAVKLAKEPMLWRVEVRRAPVELRGKEVPVTAVIGVEFKQSDILNWE
jgi:hypothetical protein